MRANILTVDDPPSLTLPYLFVYEADCKFLPRETVLSDKRISETTSKKKVPPGLKKSANNCTEVPDLRMSPLSGRTKLDYALAQRHSLEIFPQQSLPLFLMQLPVEDGKMFR
ncbi:hypothetical protein CEXT_391111 [Caerostris extrusa]|uniref:Uncharacterized protein n=1 Tax=Caerostris extrusa TaxID=172846 RepID=A0AAV4Y5L5_CAEEX|nr:hypothetical protein CEXT_391111 [Caerostris extrusa]